MPDGFRHIPSLDKLIGAPEFTALAAEYGTTAVKDAARAVLNRVRHEISDGGDAENLTATPALAARVGAMIAGRRQPPLRPVFNLTGTVIHTNLGRAPLAVDAIKEMTAAATGAVTLEYDLERGKRGDRDRLLEEQVCRLTGAEAATVVNNNAAAVLLVLNTFALGREVIVSRGELVEIGGSFRIPDVMARAGALLREVGTTNRTHARDYRDAIGANTALLMKVHTSNYEVQGFTRTVPETEIAGIGQAAKVPFVSDLGSGMLVDLARWGLPHEPTVQETLAAGADLVTFSGDKLLGGPQAGIIAGRADLIAAAKKNPLKRALRVDKVTMAALSATLRLYEDPDRLAETVPVLRLLTRPEQDIRALAEKLLPAMKVALAGCATVEVVECQSQIGSGALPVDRLPSAALALTPSDRGADALAAAFRRLPVPVIGRISGGRLLFDLRCLEDPDGFLGQISALGGSA